MSTTRTATYCDIVIEQTALALDYLKRASGLIIYKSLVPQDGRLIDEYADLTGRTIAPDYRLWLTKIGSGTIDFVFGSIDIQSCIDIAMNEAVWLGWDLEPKDAWNRLPFKPNQDLVFFGADCTILDGYGCCPVSESGFLTHIIETVHASSWPMYLIRQILNIAASIHSHEDAGLRDRKTAKALCSTPFQEIDAGLEAALHRAMAHNRTESGQKEYDTFAPKVVQGVTAFAAKYKFKMRSGIDGISASIAYAAGGNSHEADVTGSFGTKSIIDLFLEYLELAEKHPLSKAKISALQSVLHLNHLYRDHYAKKKTELPETLKEKLAGLQTQTRDIRVQRLVAKIFRSKGVFA